MSADGGGTREHDAARVRRRWLARIAGSILILTLLFLFLPRDQLFTAFRRLPGHALALAIPCYLILHLAGAFKWRLLVNSASGGLGGVDAVRCYYSGLFGSTFLPSIVGGDFVRAGLAMRLGRSKSGVVLGSVLDRSLDVLAFASVAGIGALLAPRALSPESRSIFVGLGVVVGAGGLVAALAMWLVPAGRLPMKLRRILVRVRQRGRELARRPGRMLASLSLGITLQAALALMNAWLGAFVGIDVPFHVWLFVWPLAKLSALVPLTQGGIGVREAALAALFAPFGVPAVLAVAAGLAFQGVVIGGGLVAGFIAFLLGRTGRRADRARSAAHGGARA